ncbi:phosphoribosylglycinamide formyltransferase [Demequina sp. TTPB684]|uniref:phosphoribosylglycinamide formyltransferase n=1 Tax=unclassified Demequina TaxID=2620311 RepID=UPI001CF1348B|nr:phosphoribosylglycinamide formyltransferase [Demequina sp. TMPB413]MCB2412278.1 phosphoribosylglycinamide formyltransferase [Demequina sp. TTPB684]
MTNRPARLVVLISGAGSIMSALMAAAREDSFGATVAAVISDRADAGGLEVAASAGIPTAVVALADFPDRATWDRALTRTIAAFDPELVICAGFMKLLGEPTLAAYGGRIVNTHPALLPAFPGAKAVDDALAAGVKVTGCTVMLVDEGVDTGPILAQAAVEVRDDDTNAGLHERIKDAERELVVSTVGTMVREGWTVDGRLTRLGQDLERDNE